MEGKVMLLWILIVTYFWCSTMSRPASSDHHTTFESRLINPGEEKTVAYDQVKISGSNGLCLKVRDYNPAYAILEVCGNGGWKEIMLWTIESNGTIRNNDGCLMINEKATQGTDLMFEDCNSVARNRTIWQFRDDGVIMNPASGLVITSVSGKRPRTLTMEIDTSSSFQTWHIGKDITPSYLVSITGLQGLCLQLSDKIVYVTKCVNVTGQQWLQYLDGTIRPEQNTNWCLSYDNLINKRVVALACGLDPSSQRWVFTSNNALLNERSNLVMDVQGSNPSLNKIIVRAATGDPNQSWEITPLSD